MKTTPLENWILRKTGIGERSRERLEDFQLRRVRETIAHAKSSSRFYGSRLKNVDPAEIRSLDDLTKIPFTFPQDIRDDPFRFLCVSQNEIKRIVTLRSTGTSGNEKRIFFTEDDLTHTIDFFIYGMSCLTDETDRVMVLLPGSSYGSIGDLLKKALEMAHAECFVYGVVTDPEKAIQEVVARNITSLVGIPVQVLELSRRYRDVFKNHIRSVLLSTDYVPEVLIRELTEQCGCRVFTHYGMTEMGYGGGVECEALSGYHMREADLYFEIVDPVTGRHVPDEQPGEVVFTTLTRKAMPLIRYRTGDVAAFSAVPCACGTFLKTMQRVRGRLDNTVRIGETGTLHLGELDEIVFSFPEVRDYKAGLTGDCLSIEIVADHEDAFQKSKAGIEACIRDFLDGIFEGTGDSVRLPIRVLRKNEPDTITNSMSKRTISSEVKN